MSQTTVTNYFQTLAEQMLTIEVTDNHGGKLPLDEGTQQALQLIAGIRSSGRKVLLCGNGGSSAIASHAQNDLCASSGVRAMVFTEQPLLTATANDYGYGSVYERSVQLWGEPGDLLVTVSSSGKSENIIRALNAAKEKDCSTITLSGFMPDNPSRQLGDLNFYVPCQVYGIVESAHTALAHYLTTTLPE